MMSKSISATYDYTDETGKLLYQVVRYKPKDFRQRRPDGRGGWVYNLNGIRRVPYKLPCVLDAREHGEVVFIVEGEKDVETLGSLGLIATTFACGANGWRPEYAEYFENIDVAIIPDNDEAGRKFAETVAYALYGSARSIRVIFLPDLSDKGDVTDWVEKGHGHVELMELYLSKPDYRPDVPVDNILVSRSELRYEPKHPMPGAAVDGYALTDFGNAQRFVQDCGCVIRYLVDISKWLIWDGRRWEVDDRGRIYLLAEKTIQSLYDLLKKEHDRDKSDALYKHIKRSESKPRLDAMVSLATHQEGVSVRMSELDAAPMLLNCLNGTINLLTGKLQPHSMQDMITKLVPVEYDPNAECPRWERLIAEIFAGNKELAAFMQRVLGYSLTGRTNERCIFICYGKGGNGKSVLLETFSKIMSDYAKTATIDTFLDNRGSQTNDLAALVGARFVCASETDEGRKFRESLVNAITGEDTITCRRLYHEPFSYMPTYKIMIAVNNVPTFTSLNPATRDRLKIIPFRTRFYAPEENKEPVRDKYLREILEREFPGILAWAVRGCLKWQKEGLSVPECILEESDSVLENMDRLGDFLSDCCEINPFKDVATSDLWQAYQDYCEYHQIEPAFRDIRHFSSNLVSRDGIDRRKSTGGRRMPTGIGLIARRQDGREYGNYIYEEKDDEVAISGDKRAF